MTARLLLAASLLFSLLPCEFLSVDASGQAPSVIVTPESPLEKILKEALKRRGEYVETFKNLVAEETKLTEVFDKDGTLKKQRTEVADLLVYQYQLSQQVVGEYRFIREVDGVAVKKPLERAEKLFTELARAKTPEKELRRMRDENLRYRLKYYRWGVTLQPAWQLEEKNWPDYSFEIAGHEKLASRETVVLTYRRKSFVPVEANGIFSDFKEPQVSYRGRLWLDSQTSQIRRWENDLLVQHKETGKILVVIRDELEFAESEFGILVPKRIVVSFFDRLRYKHAEGKEPRAVLGGRITYTYGAFKRFDVTSDYKIRPTHRE
jgi:hypothetical protein